LSPHSKHHASRGHIYLEFQFCSMVLGWEEERMWLTTLCLVLPQSTDGTTGVRISHEIHPSSCGPVDKGGQGFGQGWQTQRTSIYLLRIGRWHCTERRSLWVVVVSSNAAPKCHPNEKNNNSCSNCNNNWNSANSFQWCCCRLYLFQWNG